MDTNQRRNWLAGSAAALALWLAGAATAHGAADNPVQAPAPEYDGPIGRESIANAIWGRWEKRDYTWLDQFIERLAESGERAKDGGWLLAAVPDGMPSHDDEDPQWEEMLRRTDEWREKNPQSTAVDIAEAIILKEWAWSARGGGFANTVTPIGWRLFRERLQRAEAVLRRSQPTASKNPLWYQQYLEIALGLGWDEKDFQALYEAAVGRFPEYLPFYFQRVRYLAPRWNGSVEAVDSYITSVVRQTRAKHGQIMYARLYWALTNAQGEDFPLFEESKASWRDMKVGFEQLMKEYPESSWNLNSFASFACRAGDAVTYRRLRAQIGEEPYAMAWPSSLTMEDCDRTFERSVP